jgi:hypothetical protein
LSTQPAKAGKCRKGQFDAWFLAVGVGWFEEIVHSRRENCNDRAASDQKCRETAANNGASSVIVTQLVQEAGWVGRPDRLSYLCRSLADKRM